MSEVIGSGLAAAVTIAMLERIIYLVRVVVVCVALLKDWKARIHGSTTRIRS